MKHPILTVTAVGLLVIMAGFVAVGAAWAVFEAARFITETSAKVAEIFAVNPNP